MPTTSLDSRRSLCATDSQIAFDNGVTIGLTSSGKYFTGLGQVQCDRTILRSARRPMFVEIRNPWGIELLDYELENESLSDDAAILEFRAKRRNSGLMEWMLHTVRNRYNTADWTEGQTTAMGTHVRLELRPVTRTIGDLEYKGFSYQYRYQSLAIPIYKILDRGTWEIGGRAVGNELWVRSCFSPSITKITSADQFHSTEWYLPDCQNPSIFQFLPLQTQFQGFSFTAGRQGILVTWATGVSHIRSLFEKPRGSNEIVHLHEHCGDLAHSFATVPMEVLFCAADFTRVDLANAHEQVRDMVYEQLHQEIGMRRERITTYGQIEEWGPADIPRYTSVGVPKLLEAGIKHIELANHFQNNMNTWGVSNMCCTVDYKVAESVGAGNLRDLCKRANAGGAKVGMWGNTAISTLTWIFANRLSEESRIRFLPAEDSIMETLRGCDDGFVRNPSGAIESDHYTPVFAVLNLRSPKVRDYWLKCWRAAHDEIGLEGIFLDSSSNLSSDKFHFVQNDRSGRSSGATADQGDLLGKCRPGQEPPAQIKSQFRAHLDLMVAMQRIGYLYTNEDLGVFGLHRHGPALDARLDSLFLWSECIATFDVPTLESAGADAREVFFRGLAYRLMWSLFWHSSTDSLSFHFGGVRGDYDAPTAWHLSLLEAFNQVTDLMYDRHILPEEQGVIYRRGQTIVLWAFADLTMRLDGPCEIDDLLAGQRTVQGDCLQAGKHHVYVIDPIETLA